ncbi:MAG: hypothetical protein IKK21_04105 [Clostridia bacterium]|nr:hypothetical protein [Clostridia bacterium]
MDSFTLRFGLCIIFYIFIALPLLGLVFFIIMIHLIEGIRSLYFAVDSRIRKARGLPPREPRKPADCNPPFPFYTHIHDEH